MAIGREERNSSPEKMGGSILVANDDDPLQSPLQTPTTPTSATSKRDSASNNKTPPPPARRRGTVACRRCRRLRTKCVHGPECQAPCEACRAAGPATAAGCSFPRRGEKDVDRDFRRRPPTQRLSVSSSSSSTSSTTSSARGTPATTTTALQNPASSSSSSSLLAPAVQPLPTGASMPVDAPLLGRASWSSTATSHGPRSDHSSSAASISSSSSSPPSCSGLPRNGPRIQFGTAATTHQGTPLGQRRLVPGGLTVNTNPLLGSNNPNVFFPPHEEIVAGCRVFVTSYFQLGFLPKALFLDSLARNVHSVSPFLLSSILSIAARFTPGLARRYGSSARATANFVHIARALAPAEMYKPSLDRAQAFFLLAIAEWGSGDKERSAMDMGVAVRMAAILRLHREETYALPPGAPAEHVIRAESARRTFWMIHSQENLQAGYSSPAPFPLDDLTARLPCDEHDFAFGVAPAPRSVLPGTAPAEQAPDAARSKHRCLFATLVQAHHLWGQVARRACRSDLKSPGGARPWEAGSEYQTLTQQLRVFEAEMPDRHRWSLWNLRGWKAEQMHLSYLAVVMVLRVSNIVERRIYLDEILFSINNSSNPLDMDVSPKTTTTRNTPPDDHFWRTMADELFGNVCELHEQIDAFYALRARDEGFPAILVFCVYICGSLASYLWRYPQLCPRVAPRAGEMALRSVQVLGALHRAWPTSTRWNQGLQQIASPIAAAAAAATATAGDSSPLLSTGPMSSGFGGAADIDMVNSMNNNKERKGGAATTAQGFMDMDTSMVTELLSPTSEDFAIDPRLAGLSAVPTAGAVPGSSSNETLDDAGADSFWKANEAAMAAASAPDAEALSNELFEAEMSTLLSGDADFGWLDFERGA